MSLLVVDQTNRLFLTVPLEDEGMETIELLVGRLEQILTKRTLQHTSVSTLIVGDRRLTREDWRKTVDYYLLDGDTWSVMVGDVSLAASPSRNLFFRTPSGKTRSLSFHRCETVEHIKAKIEEREGLPCSQQRLMFAGKPLRDERTLAEYGILPDCTLELNIELLGGSPPCSLNNSIPSSEPLIRGVPFADITNNDQLVRKKWSNRAPKWRVANQGLCIEGVCRNKECSAYKNGVVMNYQFKEFDLIEDSCECKCPICQQHVVPTNFGVNNCKWMYVGKKVVSAAQRPIIVRQEWKVADDAYHTCKLQTGDAANWLRLKIRAKRLKHIPSCDICQMGIIHDPTKLSCGHTYHAPCIDNWRADNVSCPICKGVQLQTPTMRRAAGQA